MIGGIKVCLCVWVEVTTATTTSWDKIVRNRWRETDESSERRKRWRFFWRIVSWKPMVVQVSKKWTTDTSRTNTVGCQRIRRISTGTIDDMEVWCQHSADASATQQPTSTFHLIVMSIVSVRAMTLVLASAPMNDIKNFLAIKLKSNILGSHFLHTALECIST